MRNKRNWLRLIMVSLVLAYVAIASVQYRHFKNLEDVMRRSDLYALYASMDLNVEYQRMDLALYQYLTEPSSDTLANVQTRYNLFATRCGSMDTKTLLTLLQNEPLYSTTVKQLRTFLDRSDERMAKIDGSASAAVPGTISVWRMK